TIQGTGGGKTHTYDVTLVVQPNAPMLDHFEFSPISSPKVANTSFTVTITAKDQYGNTYTGFNSSINLSVNKGSISPTTTSNFVNGVLSNFQVTIPTANTGVTITATYSGKTGTSNSFDVNPTITASAGSGGYISPSGTISVNYGESKTFTITPYSGYKISNVQVDGVSVGAVSTYTFQNVTANHTIEASFEKEINQIVIVLQVGNSAFAVNGETRYLDSPPIIKNGRTLVPIRTIIEALGGTVQWNPDEKRVDIILGNNHLIFQIGNPNAYVNGVQKFIDASNTKVYPEIINGRTMIPLRFVAENLGCDVKWDPNTQTITITYGG
ncbi:MAG: copper amine oxidase N-terminal domain-containing protein, partial [Caldisericum sp.]|nr:copper amine oxidase N-terminal domain-containing protein [Caldisericum sp.]